MAVGTKNNVERSGSRNDLTFSSFIREIPGVRHMDLDMMQICPGCNKPYAIFELTSASDKQTYLLENISSMMGSGVEAYLITHAFGDVKHVKPIIIQRVAKKFKMEPVTTDWESLKLFLNKLRSKHIATSNTERCRTVTENEIGTNWRTEHPEWNC